MGGAGPWQPNFPSGFWPMSWSFFLLSLGLLADRVLLSPFKPCPVQANISFVECEAQKGPIPHLPILRKGHVPVSMDQVHWKRSRTWNRAEGLERVWSDWPQGPHTPPGCWKTRRFPQHAVDHTPGRRRNLAVVAVKIVLAAPRLQSEAVRSLDGSRCPGSEKLVAAGDHDLRHGYLSQRIACRRIVSG